MNILVTGGAGFIGSNYIINHLKTTSNNILNYDKLTYAGNLDNLALIESNPNYSYKNGCISNYKQISNLINTFKPDRIVNFAAESHVDRSIDGPMEFLKTNIIGVGTLLEGIRNYINNNPNKGSDFKFLHVSTDEVYGSLDSNDKFTEQTPYDPSSPYSASKASSDHLVRAWHRTFGIPILITNCSNNYGPYQFPEKLIPLMIINCLNEKELPIYGDGKNVRDWLFVKDHCTAIDAVLNKGVIGETYNIGGNNEIENIQIVMTICNILDELHPRENNLKYSELIKFVTDRPGHDFRYAIDASKIMSSLDWKPKETFETGIYKTIMWYINNKEWWSKIIDKDYKQQRLGLVT